MTLSQQVLDEIRLLVLFNPGSAREGIKVHHDADPDMIAACQRLFDKGLITQRDGGYLTDAGLELERHIDAVTTVLNSDIRSTQSA